MPGWIKYLAVAGLTLAGIAAIFGTGYVAGRNDVTAQWHAERQQHAQALAQQADAYRQRERDMHHAIQQLTEQAAAQQAQTEAHYRDLLADRQRGTLQLRQQFRGCRQQLSQATRATGSRDATDQSGLSHEDETAFVRLARDADTCAHRLTLAQDYIRSTQ